MTLTFTLTTRPCKASHPRKLIFGKSNLMVSCNWASIPFSNVSFTDALSTD